MTSLSSLALLLAGTGLLGCYKPNILEGGFKCNLDAGTKACPDGFKCDPVMQRCFKNLPDAGVDRAADAVDGRPDAVDAGPDGGDGGSPEVGPSCFDPKPNCTPAIGMCDPFCGSGCTGRDGAAPCREKCSVNTAGNLTCNEPRMMGFPRGLMQSCQIESNGSGAQTDNCGPGLVCIEDGCFARCYQFCRVNADCTDSTCTRDVGGGHWVCDVPFVDSCVPLPGMQNTGCGGGNMACYLNSASPTHTICDCPFNAVGQNQPCTVSRDCIRGLACADPGNGQGPVCLQVCRRGTSDCPNGPNSCRQYLGLPAGATPHPTYGYCF
jgi:hypothetical protein